MSDLDGILTAKATAAKRFLQPTALPTYFTSLAMTSSRPHHNVVGVGVGHKVTSSKATDTLCVRLYVERKLPKALIPKSMQLPASIGGVATDIVESGLFSAAPAKAVSPRDRTRPARPGCSVGFKSTKDIGLLMAGTFGAVVSDCDGVHYVLSNNHVLADENRLPLQSRIYQPGLLDGGQPKNDAIAKLSRFVRLKKTGSNSVDAAIARALKPSYLSTEFLPKIGNLKSGLPADPVERMKVCKVGRTTGYTEGVITDIAADVAVNYEIGTLVFTDQIIIRRSGSPFSASGDSGSLIVDRNSRCPVGLLFGGSAAYSLANPLKEVLSRLKVSVVV